MGVASKAVSTSKMPPMREPNAIWLLNVYGRFLRGKTPIFDLTDGAEAPSWPPCWLGQRPRFLEALCKEALDT